jgi:Ca2+-binding EF-hand superfamily protein
VIEKLGVWMGSHDDISKLFNYYDVNANGCLEYNEFIAAIYNTKSSQ